MRNRTGEQLTQAQATLKQVRQMLESKTVLQVAGEDRQRRLKSSLTAIEGEIESIRQTAEGNDAVSRVARGIGTEDDLAALMVYQTESD